MYKKCFYIEILFIKYIYFYNINCVRICIDGNFIYDKNDSHAIARKLDETSRFLPFFFFTGNSINLWLQTTVFRSFVPLSSS